MKRYRTQRSADRDAQRLAERQILLAHAEDDELLQLVGRRQVARQLWLGRDDLLRDLEIGAEEEAGPCTGHVDRLHPALQVRLRAVLDELLDDETEAVTLDRLHVLLELAGGHIDGLRHFRRHVELRLNDLDGGEEHDLQLTERREQVLDVVLTAVVAEMLTDDEREL